MMSCTTVMPLLSDNALCDVSAVSEEETLLNPVTQKERKKGLLNLRQSN